MRNSENAGAKHIQKKQDRERFKRGERKNASDKNPPGIKKTRRP